MKKNIDGRAMQKRRRLKPAEANRDPEGKDCANPLSYLRYGEYTLAFPPAPREGEDLDLTGQNLLWAKLRTELNTLSVLFVTVHVIIKYIIQP